MKLEDLKSSYSLNEIPQELAKQVQECLVFGRYLEQSDVDGIIGAKTLKAFQEFKDDYWLAQEDILGYNTAQKLLTLKEKSQAADEAQCQNPQEIKSLSSDLIGSKSGASMILPDNTRVYQYEYIIEGIPLTWGECTKNCTRKPTQNSEVYNAHALARQFGDLRDKFGSPITITSGFRPLSVNRACGGVSNSQHIPFKALDMIPNNGDYKKLWQCLKASQFAGLGDGVSTGKGFYHADIRDSGRVIFGY